ncbi:MAG: 5'-3' exonuclease H3TH domain-containing protein [Lentisphaeria bacterium]|nr:5'-3' exonuclease H3TH domain-containing protein [Lentisphaeria bacterium]
MPASPPQLVLIDGFAQIYRAFHAIRHLTNTAGHPTNALFGVARFFQTLAGNFDLTYSAFVLDKGVPQTRLERLPSYKANRPPMPDDLRAQIQPIREWVEALGIPIFERAGYEADDLIAGLATADLDVEILIVSPDKDLGQLVKDNHTRMIIPGKQGNYLSLGEAQVEEKFGVPPTQVRDWLALVGDTADNIPGVPGIGPKTAAQLLRQFGSIDGILENLDAVPRETIRQSITTHADRIRDNKHIVALIPALPDTWENVESSRKRAADYDQLFGLADTYQLNAIKKTLLTERNQQKSPALFDFF